MDAMEAERRADAEIAAAMEAQPARGQPRPVAQPARDNGTQSARSAAAQGIVARMTIEAHAMNAVRTRAQEESRVMFDAVDMARFRAVLALVEMPAIGDRVADVSRLVAVAEQFRGAK